MSILARFEKETLEAGGNVNLEYFPYLILVKPPIPAQSVRVSYAVVGEECPLHHIEYTTMQDAVSSPHTRTD